MSRFRRLCGIILRFHRSGGDSVGLTTTNQWFAYPGPTSVTNVNITLDATRANVFFRLAYPKRPGGTLSFH
jgi:hypothetical protein